MALKYPDRLESNNPVAYGIVKAIEVAGHKTVSDLTKLYALADPILSDTGSNTDNDAIGQEWYVVSEGCRYKLVDWAGRKSAAGWKKVENASDITTAVDNYTINGQKISTNPVLDGADIALTGYSKAGSISAIAPTDTVNVAIGKLEKKADDNNTSILNEINTIETELGFDDTGHYNPTESELSDMTVTEAIDSINQRVQQVIESKGQINGYASLDATGKVPSSQLPSYVDDVLEYDTRTSFPGTGESGKIYVSADNNKTWRWSGTDYVEISPGVVIGTTTGTAYDGGKGTALETWKNAVDDLSAVTSINTPTASTTTVTLPITKTALVNEKTTSSANVEIPTATTSTAGVMSSSDKTRLDGIFAGNLSLPSVAITGTWKFFNNGGEEVVSSTISPVPDTNNPKIERGYQAQFSGTYKWTHQDGKKDPTQVQAGSSWEDLPASATNSSTYTSDKVTTNTTVKIGIQAAKTGLMVSGSNVVPASGMDTSSASKSVTFADRFYYGASASAISEGVIKALTNDLNAVNSRTISNVTTNGTEYYMMAYPSSLGDISTIIQDGATPVLGAFTKSTLDITNSAGLSVKLNVYRSNNPGAFTNNSLKIQL